MKTNKSAVWKIPVLLFLCILEAAACLYLIGLFGRGSGWIFACIPLLQTGTAALFLFKRKDGEEKGAEKEENPEFFGFKSIGRVLYAGAVISSALLVAAPLRLLTDKITGLLDVESMLPITYTGSPLTAAFVLLLVFPVASELLHRHLLQERLYPQNNAVALILASAFYALSFPLVNLFFPRIVCGLALAWIYKNTRSYFACWLSALMTCTVSVVYQFMLASGISDGSGTSWTSLAGFALICLAAAGVTFIIAESVYKKRTPKKIEVFAGILIFAILLVAGIALAAL